MKMIRVTLSILFLSFAIFAWGQESNSLDEVSIKKEINNIKLTGDAIYADLYQDAIQDQFDLDKVKARSKEMLMTHVIEIFSKRLKMSKEDVREIWDVLDQHCANIVVKKGDLFRVFTYVMKNAIGIGKPKEKSDAPILMAQASVSENEMEEQEVIASSTIVSEVEQKDNSVIVPDTVVQVASNVESKLESNSKAIPDTIVTKISPIESQPVVVPDTVIPVALKIDPKPEPEIKPEPQLVSEPVVKVEPVLEVVVPDLCQTMISKGKMNELMRFLNQEKKYQRLMFGNRNSMQFLDKCYIVIIEKSTQSIVAVLDKGESERMNFVSKKMDNLTNYRGGNYAAVYVQEY